MRIKNTRNYESVNVCKKCRRRNLHYDAVEAGYRKCPECVEIDLGIFKYPKPFTKVNF